ncbi:hypothetical protein Pint_05131 [Pistacia integerrima]|uniref:Uncharacterized protein n=1 Tax=Pistacia integerrima TaxID=434235 RepID=A0ACC0Z7M3_9ROSI|nr:hypothetical protein Pint_05131 [Pistacia integerrima]
MHGLLGMAPNKVNCIVILLYFFCGAASVSNKNQKAELIVNASERRPIPQTFFGIFFEVVYLRQGKVTNYPYYSVFLQEINHAGAGGLWAELVSNRGHSLFFYLYI